MDHVRKQIDKQVIASTSCVQEGIKNRKNSFQVYGYDFMVDDDLNCWLIEINSSPAMSYKN